MKYMAAYAKVPMPLYLTPSVFPFLLLPFSFFLLLLCQNFVRQLS